MSNKDSLKKDLDTLILNMGNGDYESADKVFQRIESTIDKKLLLDINDLKIYIGEMGIEGELNKAKKYLESGNCVDALFSLDNVNKYVPYINYKSYFETVFPIHDKIKKDAIRLLDRADLALFSKEYDKVDTLFYRAKQLIKELVLTYYSAYGQYLSTYIKPTIKRRK